MAFKSREAYESPKRGRGRLVVSEGVAPAEHILPDETLPTLLTDPVHDEFFEAIILKGTIISVYPVTHADGTTTYCAGPCIAGATGYELQMQVADPADGLPNSNDADDMWQNAGYTLLGSEEFLGMQYRPKSGYELKGVPQGVLVMDAYRPFSTGMNEGVSFITHGYVEYPLVRKVDDVGGANTVIFDNTDLAIGDFVMPDLLGRPVKWSEPWGERLKIGRVLYREDIGGATPDYDYGFKQYMQLPYDDFEKALLETANSGTYINGVDVESEIFGVRANLDGLLDENEVATYTNDPVAGVIGAVRVQLVD